jgi:hypothetical protein
VAVSFIGGGNWSNRRKPQTCRKSLTNFITWCCIEYTFVHLTHNFPGSFNWLVENRHKGHLRFPFYLFRTKLVSMEDIFQFLTVLSSQYNLKIALNNNHSLTSPSTYHLCNCEFESRSWRSVLDTTSCDKVCQWLANYVLSGQLDWSTNVHTIFLLLICQEDYQR